MQDKQKRILCYGDSNTWGYTPGTGARYAPDIRWTGRLQQLLPADYTVIEDGMNGRTTVYDDPAEMCRNGLKGLGYSLLASKPLDLVILCLGTNDLHFTGAIGAARGMDEVVRVTLGANTIFGGSTPIFRNDAKVLLMAPQPFHPDSDKSIIMESLLEDKLPESRRLGQLYKAVAEEYGVFFLDVGQYATSSPVDGIHMEPQDHRALAQAVAEKVREILPR